MLVVDDGSTDKTREVVADLADRHSEVRLISLGRNMGKATALRRGFERALLEGAEVVVMMDADGQDDPAELPLLLARLDDGADLVTGARTVRNDRFVKRNTSKLYNAATARLSGAPGKDFNSGFKVMRADVARNASPMLYGELHRYLTVVAHWLGYRVAEVSVQHHERLHGKTKYGLARFWRGFVDLLTVRFLMSYESRPSHLFSGLGLASMAAGGLALDLPVRREGLGRGDRRPAAAHRRRRHGARRAPAGPVRPAGRAASTPGNASGREQRRPTGAGTTATSWWRSASSSWPSPPCSPSSAPLRTGISTDEPIHVMRLRNFFDTGWYALDWDYTGRGPGRRRHQHLRLRAGDDAGPARLVGALGRGGLARRASTSRTPTTCATSGSSSSGWSAWPPWPRSAGWCSGSWRWGLVAAAVLAATPMWTGHVMFNVKDVPVATGHTLCHPRPAAARAGRAGPLAARLARAGCLVAGLVLTLGTRPGMWSGLSVLLAVAVVGVLVAADDPADGAGRPRRAGGLLRRRGRGPGRDLPEPLRLTAAGAAPHQRGLVELPERRDVRPALRAAAPWRGPADPAPAVRADRDRSSLVALLLRATARANGSRTARLALVGVQAFTLPVAAVVLGSDLYHGLRQLLFIDPRPGRAGGLRHGLVLASAALARARARPAGRGRRRWCCRSSTR